MKLVCDCLNLKLNIKANILEPSDKKNLNIEDGTRCDDFFDAKLALCQLDIEGVQQKYACLISHHTVGDWIVAHCLNCDLNTHAVSIHNGGDEILVNTRLKSGPTCIEQLQKSSNYSPLYKLVIHARPDRQELLLKTDKYASAHVGLTNLQQLVNNFLITEELEMENRIREFTEKEHTRYAELQNKVRSEKNTLIRLVLASGESDLETSSSFDFDGGASSGPTSPQEEDQKVPKLRTINQNLKVQKEKKTPLGSADIISTSPETDEIFMLDPFDDDSPMHYTESDEESEEESSMGSNSSRDIPVRSMYSSSMPVKVPVWRPQRQGAGPELDDPDDMPSDIAASIKALAQSVCEDGTEIFGDLPRKKTSRIRFTAEKIHK